MAKPAATRPVQCYHCRHRFEVAAQARTGSCPKCSKALQFDDVVVADYFAVRKVQTCGKVVVNKKGRIVAQLVEASGGIEVQGAIEAKVVTPGRVHIGPKGHLKGDCLATTLAVELGATITGGIFQIPDPNAQPPAPQAPEPAPEAIPTSPPPRSAPRPAARGPHAAPSPAPPSPGSRPRSPAPTAPPRSPLTGPPTSRSARQP